LEVEKAARRATTAPRTHLSTGAFFELRSLRIEWLCGFRQTVFTDEATRHRLIHARVP
jgi:hypothetical protein